MQNIHQCTYIFCFYEGLHFKCTLIAALWTILCDDFHVFLQTENLAFCTFPLHFIDTFIGGLIRYFQSGEKLRKVPEIAPPLLWLALYRLHGAAVLTMIIMWPFSHMYLMITNKPNKVKTTNRCEALNEVISLNYV